MKLSEVTKGMEGTLLRDGSFDQLSYLTETGVDRFLAFFENEKFAAQLSNPKATCILTTPAQAEKIPGGIEGVFLCERPKEAWALIHNALADNEDYVGKSFDTVIGKNCSISPLAVIPEKNVVIGDNVTIEPFVVFRERVTIGNDVLVGAGTVLGVIPFNYAKDADGQPFRMKSAGKLIIGDHVEMLEYVTVGIGIFPWESTVIGEGSKMDAFSNLGHGAHMGKNCEITYRAICAGNTRIGDNVFMGIGAITRPRVRVGDNARISIGSVVTTDVPAGETYTGNFAIPHQRYMKNLKESIREDD